jgi:dienelactone hydrolase
MALAATASFAPIEHAGATESPEPVTFPSADGKATLKGYLFKPATVAGGRVPAVGMMHGRAGAYSTLAKAYDTSTLSQRHRMWGRLWAEQGYLALLVDGFGPRGYPQGFPRGSYDFRPGELNEVTIPPLDAYGALAYLRSRPDVAMDRVGLLGWSNGGSAAMATMSISAPGIKTATPASGFRAALAFYPACGLKGQFDNGYQPYAPVRIFMGTADDEVSPRRCGAWWRRAAHRVPTSKFGSTKARPTASTTPAEAAKA